MISAHYTPKFLAAMERVAKELDMESRSRKFVEEMKELGWEERIKNLYRIKDKQTGLFVFFQPNRGQRRYMAQRTKRDEILKSRQIGFTTWSCIYAYDRALWDAWSTGIMSHVREKTVKIFEIVKNANDWFKRDWGKFFSPVQSQDSANSIMWEETKASITVAFDFRSLTVRFLHVSEAGFIEDERLSNSIQSVPSQGEVILESTSNGAGGTFYDNWELHRKDPEGVPFKCHFFPWFDNYPEDPIDEWEGKNLKYTEREKELKELYSLEDYHLAWRRWKIYESYKNEEELFEIDYPSNDEDCFRSGQNQVFSASVLGLQSKFVKEPLYTGRIDCQGKKFSFYADAKGLLKVWDLPKAGVQYSIGADIAEGIGKDFTVATVTNKNTGEQVAGLRGFITPDELVEELYKLGYFYNYCFICPEMNSFGLGVVNDLIKKGYTKLYKRYEMEELSAQKTKKLGFRTTPQTKPKLINNFVAACKEGKFRVRDAILLEEMNSFIQLATKTGKSLRYEAKSGKKDDYVISAALSYEMLSQIPDMNDYDLALPDNLKYDEDTGFLVTKDNYDDSFMEY